MQVEDINLLDRDVFAQGVPHAWFTYLREHEPMFHHQEPGGPGFWVVSKHADVRAIGRDPSTYSSDPVAPLEEQQGVELSRGKTLISMDPPEHTRYRKLVNHGFTPRMVSLLETHIRELTVRLVDRAVAMGACDFVIDVAGELPLEVIVELMGVPREDRQKILDWTNVTLGTADAGEIDPEYQVGDDQLEKTNMELARYVRDLCELRRQKPGDDIMSALLLAEVDGDKLTDSELTAFFQFLSSAGNETTRNAAAHGLSAFLDDPREWDKLVQDPEGLAGSAAEEILRWASPVMYLRRNVTRDTDLRGQPLKAGEKVSIWYISANRDEEVFEDPFRFNIEREPNDHLALGGGGPHFCLGASLARLELRVLFEELARRAPTIRALGPPAHLRSNIVAGIKHLPVDLRATVSVG